MFVIAFKRRCLRRHFFFLWWDRLEQHNSLNRSSTVWGQWGGRQISQSCISFPKYMLFSTYTLVITYQYQMTQFMTGHAHFKSYLYHLNFATNAHCNCRNGTDNARTSALSFFIVENWMSKEKNSKHYCMISYYFGVILIWFFLPCFCSCLIVSLYLFCFVSGSEHVEVSGGANPPLSSTIHCLFFVCLFE